MVANMGPTVEDSHKRLTDRQYPYSMQILLSSTTLQHHHLDTQGSDSILKLSNLMGHDISLQAKVAPSMARYVRVCFYLRIKDNEPFPICSQ